MKRVWNNIIINARLHSKLSLTVRRTNLLQLTTPTVRLLSYPDSNQLCSGNQIYTWTFDIKFLQNPTHRGFYACQNCRTSVSHVTSHAARLASLNAPQRTPKWIWNNFTNAGTTLMWLNGHTVFPQHAIPALTYPVLTASAKGWQPLPACCCDANVTKAFLPCPTDGTRTALLSTTMTHNVSCCNFVHSGVWCMPRFDMRIRSCDGLHQRTSRQNTSDL